MIAKDNPDYQKLVHLAGLTSQILRGALPEDLALPEAHRLGSDQQRGRKDGTNLPTSADVALQFRKSASIENAIKARAHIGFRKESSPAGEDGSSPGRCARGCKAERLCAAPVAA